MDSSTDSSMDSSTDSSDSEGTQTPFSQKGSKQAPGPAAGMDVDDTDESSSSDSDDESVSDDSMASDSDGDGNRAHPSRPNRSRQQRAATPPRPSDTSDVAQDVISRKRKAQTGQQHDEASWGEALGGNDEGEDKAGAGVQQAKKVKLNGDQGTSLAAAAEHHLPHDRSLLRAEIWHHIFTFCPPKALGNLMSVNKSFHSYLDPSALSAPALERRSAHSGVLAVLKPNSIWQASRRLYWPCMPTPLQSKTELDMWRLACSLSCQHCGKPGSPVEPASGEPRHGPGKDGVAIVWPFSTCICGPCLLQKSIKEIDLLLSSSTPSILMPAIPFVLLTEKLHVLSSSLAERGHLPRDTQLTKVFWRTGVESVKQEFLDVKGMGMATTEEWLKGLEGRGAEHQQDSSRWEKYAASGGISRMREMLYPGYDPKAHELTTPSSRQPSSDLVSHDNANGSAPAIPPHTSAATGIPSLPPRALPLPRHERTREEVAELKALRKAEIERKAMLLDPPMHPSLLVHMPSFQAATQIITPLDDNAWELLKPRLLAQREEAEKREKEAALQASIQKELAGRNKTAESSTDKEPTDNDWDEIQGPLRGRISRHADEVILSNWEDGDKVSKDTCADFAAEVLLYVRRQFYVDVAKDAAAARAAGKEPIVDPLKGPFTQKLTLENMKWIFDVKIKPHTESLRKELFLCNGCQGNFKYYGFEGVVQHYAAKHTTALSAGNVVVHWRAEWPEIPPFSPDPRAVKQAYHQARQAAYRQDNTQSQYPHGPFPSAPPAPPYAPQPAPGYQAGPPVPPYGPQPYPEPYPPAQPTAYPPPGGYAQPGYGQPPYHPPPGPYPAYQTPPTPAGPYPPPSSYGGASVPAPPPPVSQTGPPPPPGPYSYNYNAYQGNSGYGYPGAAAPYPDRYRAQLEEMAKLSRELWNATASFKELPGSAKLQVIVYHMAKRFHAKFSEPPPLTMFIDGLSNNKDMRPVRNVNGLMCKVCHTGFVSPPPTEQDRKSFSMPQLANHFQIRHVEPAVNMGQYAPVPDWAADMILLPDLSGLSSLRKPSAGGDSQKYSLLTEALPHFFQAGVHHGVSYQPAPESQWPANPDHHQQQLPLSADKHERFYGTGGPGTPEGGASHVANGHMNGGPKLQGTSHAEASRKPFLGQQQHSQEQNKKNKKKKQGSKGQNGNVPRKGAEDRGPRTRAIEGNEREAKAVEDLGRRQEEVIRAMWASDRAQSARMPSVPAVAQGGNGSSHSRGASGRHGEQITAPQTRPTYGTRVIKEESLPPVSRIQAPLNPAYHQQASYPPQDYQPPNASDREGSDPLAALEMYLDQERNRASTDTRQQPASRVAYDDDRQGAISRDPRGTQAPPDQYQDRYGAPARAEGSRRRSLSPVYVRYVDQAPPADKYRERSPPPLHGEPLYRARQAPPMEEVVYERAPREYYQVYKDDRRPRPVEYEAYELVRARDAQGEYYIRRPVRREPEPEGYYNGPHQEGSYSTGPPIRREVAYVPYEQPARYPSRQTGQPYDTRDPAPTRAAEPGPVSRADPAYYEEYDPHYPAAVAPPPGPIGRPVRYQ